MTSVAVLNFKIDQQCLCFLLTDQSKKKLTFDFQEVIRGASFEILVHHT